MNYYEMELNQLEGDTNSHIVQVQNNKSKTKWMSLNKESIESLISWLMELSEEVND